MGFFSKNLSKDTIAEDLVATFAVSRDSLLKGVTESVEDGSEISNEQDHEIMILALLANIHPYIITFGDDSNGKYIIAKFQDAVFNTYIFDKKEREDFKKKFNERCKEYYEAYRSDNEDVAIQIGQIFCTHFFGKKEDGSHTGMMFVVGAIFLKIQIEVKKTLDEILANFVIV